MGCAVEIMADSGGCLFAVAAVLLAVSLLLFSMITIRARRLKQSGVLRSLNDETTEGMLTIRPYSRRLFG